ncbi:MAG TPA: AraC family transcriptional regulator, partial [Lentisphaeria bacterium]|nr:AraC family transcriptional regulator [Lentisphaeria bacterium]
TLPTETIIRQCGFSDRTLFYRMFRLRFGMTPAEYRISKHNAPVRN